MKLEDTFEETYTALSANKVRSGLTMLGIIIGISSVIALVSVGQGAQNSISSNISSLGSNLIEVLPGAARTTGSFGVSAGRGTAKSLLQGDADAIATGVQNVVAVASEVSGRYQVTAKGTNTNTTVIGTTSQYPQIRNLNIAEGTFITDGQNLSLAKVAVLGPTAAADLFGTDTDPLGQTIRIKNVSFTVVGVATAKGGTGFNNPDTTVYIPATSAERFLAGSQYLSTIDVQATDAPSMAQAQVDITALLLQRHNIADASLADFNILNQNDLLATVSSIAQTFTILLGAVAGISLLVGGIGIMNMMLTTVTERTREIGLRKAIGARRRDISLQFLTEAVALTLIGGIIGITLGMLISFGISYFGILQTSVSLQAILLAFGVSAAIGITFGYYPARRAANLNPIEALRYE
ncbi:MAG: ABC transporter permease [bacterium]